MAALRIFFEHRDAVAFIVIHKTAVPVFERGKQRVASVLFIALVRAERDVGSEMLEVLLIEAFEALLVEIVPFVEVLESGALVLDDKMRMRRAEGIPHAHFLVEVALVSVLYRILDNLADLLLKQVNLLDLERSGLDDKQGEVPDLAEVRRKFLIQHICLVEQRIASICAQFFDRIHSGVLLAFLLQPSICWSASSMLFVIGK